jgi:Ca2+-binding EF-hand superfamily protein
MVLSERLKKLLFRLVDRNSNTELISFSEFVHFDLLISSSNRELEILFNLVDANRDGLIDRNEFRNLVIEFGGDPLQFDANPLVQVLF